MPEINPGSGWDGTASSGFATLPVDPVRVSAKPAMRLLVPPRQAFTDSLLVGVYAAANDGGSLYNDLGLSHVRFHYEGAVEDVLAPSRQSFDDANGQVVSYYGWWIRLKHDGTHGTGNLYVEAIASDASMQHRVIGPFAFFPSASLHDLEIEVAPSQPVINGVRYPTLRDARNYARAQGADRPRITITEPGELVFGDTQAAYVGEGYLTYEATAPVTLTLDQAAVEAGTRGHARYRSKYGRQHLKGSNITIDFKHALEFFNESGLGSPPDWFDGVNFINPLGREDLWRGYPRSRKLSNLIRGLPYLTECQFTNLPFSGSNASLVRGCTIDHGWQECFTGSNCVIGNRVTDFNSSTYMTPIDAMQVSYGGPGSSATLSCPGDWGDTSRTFTAKVGGSVVGTFTVYDGDAEYHAGTNYTVQNVVDWINGLSGWNATLLDDSRFAASLSIPGGDGGAFADIDVKGAGFTFVTEFDLHPDYYQIPQVGKENAILADNIGTDVVAQSLFMKDGSSRDFLVINNVFDNAVTDAYISQFGNTHSHVVIANNSWTRQNLWLRVNVQGYDPDGYSMFANNAVPAMDWEDGIDTDLTVASNHLHAGATSPTGSGQTSLGGDETTLYRDIANKDFAPSGALLSNPKITVVRYDQQGIDRGPTSAAGALA